MTRSHHTLEQRVTLRYAFSVLRDKRSLPFHQFREKDNPYPIIPLF
jgi:hypothetical protein